MRLVVAGLMGSDFVGILGGKKKAHGCFYFLILDYLFLFCVPKNFVCIGNCCIFWNLEAVL